MNYANFLDKLQKLPIEKQAEVLDVVEFLAARHGAVGLNEVDAWSEQDFAQFSMHHAMQGLVDEVYDYTEQDLKEHWS